MFIKAAPISGSRRAGKGGICFLPSGFRPGPGAAPVNNSEFTGGVRFRKNATLREFDRSRPFQAHAAPSHFAIKARASAFQA